MGILENAFDSADVILNQQGQRDGIPIDKGVILNEAYLIEHEEQLKKVCNLFSVYPDLYLDLISPSDDSFSLFFYQRIFLRAVMRFKIVNVTACRAWSKSFITILGLVL